MAISHPIKTYRQCKFKIILGLTYRCQCKCVYCSCGTYLLSERKELTTKEILEITKQIAHMPSFFTVISFFGGEALLRDNIFEFINFACRRGLFTELETNGLLLNLENVKKLKKGGLHHVFIRLESSNPEAHDALSNYKGCFEKAIEGIKNCIKEKIACSISTIALKEKIYNKDLEKIIDLGKQLKVASIRILYPTLTGNWLDMESQLLNEYESGYVKSLLKPAFIYLHPMYSTKRNAFKICNFLGRELFYISPYGEVQPCPFVPLVFGNVRSTPLLSLVENMWQSGMFKGHKNEDCLMNSIDFRKKYIKISNS